MRQTLFCYMHECLRKVPFIFSYDTKYMCPSELASRCFCGSEATLRDHLYIIIENYSSPGLSYLLKTSVLNHSQQLLKEASHSIKTIILPIYCDPALAIVPLWLSARDIDPSWLILTNISQNHPNVSQYYSTSFYIFANK